MKTIIKRLELLEAARRAHAEAMVGLDYSEARRQLEERLDGIRARLGGGFEDWPTESRPDPVKVRQMIDEAIAETRGEIVGFRFAEQVGQPLKDTKQLAILPDIRALDVAAGTGVGQDY